MLLYGMKRNHSYSRLGVYKLTLDKWETTCGAKLNTNCVPASGDVCMCYGVNELTSFSRPVAAGVGPCVSQRYIM